MHLNLIKLWHKLSEAALVWLESGSSPSVVTMLIKMKGALWRS